MDQTINISQYCDLEGLNQNDRFVLEKLYFNKGVKTYTEWRNTVKDQIDLKPAKEEFTQKGKKTNSNK